MPIQRKEAKCLIDGLGAIDWKYSILNTGLINILLILKYR